VERFNLKKQSELEVRKQYHVKISSRVAVLEKNESEDINRAWGNTKRISKSQLKRL